MLGCETYMLVPWWGVCYLVRLLLLSAARRRARKNIAGVLFFCGGCAILCGCELTAIFSDCRNTVTICHSKPWKLNSERDLREAHAPPSIAIDDRGSLEPFREVPHGLESRHPRFLRHLLFLTTAVAITSLSAKK